MRIQQATRTTVMLALLGSGCEIFSDDDDSDSFGDDESDTSSNDDEGEDPPDQGFRVYPKFMLQDLSAIVTIELDGVTPLACELDGDPAGGYLCDASSLPAGGIATVMVEKDGFESAIRHPQLAYGQVMPIEIHLAVEGGPTGVWSACQPAGDFESCEGLCATFQTSCQVTSCATADPEWPLATYETFADAECTTLTASVTAACESELPLAGTVAAVRCCCAS